MAITRRDLLKRAGAAGAAGLVLSHATWISAQSGRPVEPARDGQIRIKDVQCYRPGPLYVRITTDAGIEGWGEVNVISSRIAKAIVETYRPLLLGVNPTRVEHLWQVMHRAHRNMRGGIAFASAIAGVDMALWDILGKVAKLPVHVLLGGPCRRELVCYPSSNAHKVTSHRLHAMVERPSAIDSIADDVRKTRQKLGKDGYVMLDGHGKFTAQVAIQLARKIEDQDVLFFEEVVPPENNKDLLKVKRATDVPLAVGERMSTIWPFRSVLEKQVADVLNPDIVEIGGISQMRKLAAFAEVYDVPLAPHSTHTMLGLAASLQVAASVNNFLIHEAYEHIATRPGFLSGVSWSKDKRSVVLPEGPGLGVKVDLDGLKEADAKAKEDPGLRKAYFLNDGSVADR